MKFAPTQKITSFLLAAVSAAPLLNSGEIGLVYSLCFIGLWLLGWLLEPPLTYNRRFRLLINITVLGVLAIQLVQFILGTPIAIAGMEFAVVFLGIKLCSRASASDYYQIIILSFLHVIAATVTTNDLSYGIAFLIFVSLSTLVLVLSYLRQEMERRFGPDVQPDGSEMLRRLLNSKRIISPGFVLGTTLLSVPVLLLTVFLFIVFPRIGLGLLGRLPSRQATAGFSDEVTLGDLDIGRQENRVLIRLEPFGIHGDQPTHLPIKLRGAVFDRFETGTWKKPRRARWKKMKHNGNRYALHRKSASTEKFHGYDVLLVSIEPPFIFLPDGAQLIQTYTMAQKGGIQPRLLETSREGTIRYDDKAKVGIRYRVHLSDVPPYGEAPNDDLAYLDIPPGHERVVQMAMESIPSGVTDKESVAAALVQTLKTDYHYSTQLSSAKLETVDEDALHRFLFTRKTGYCEHFATALTLLLRASGIPARLVTGFSGADWNGIGGYYVVRQRFAHAWTEAFLDGKWVSLDATPPTQMSSTKYEYSELAMIIDTIRMRWHKRVVGYNVGTQAKIAVGLWRRWIHRFGYNSKRTSVPKWILAFLTSSIIIVIAYRRWRRLSPRSKKGTEKQKRRTTKRLREASRLYQLVDRRLSRLGYPRPASNTPDEHIRHIANNDKRLAELAQRLTRRYNEVRFGQKAFKRGEVSRLKRQLRLLKRSSI
jgi:protein-glutamine gamma-glutamyltransferase